MEKTYGQVNYETYQETRVRMGGIEGAPWDALSEDERLLWDAGAVGVLRTLKRKTLAELAATLDAVI